MAVYSHRVLMVLCFKLLFLKVKTCSPCDCVNRRLTCVGLYITEFPSIPDVIAYNLTRIEIYNTRISCLKPVEYGFQHVAYFIEEQNHLLNCSCLIDFINSISITVITTSSCSEINPSSSSSPSPSPSTHPSSLTPSLSPSPITQHLTSTIIINLSTTSSPAKNNFTLKLLLGLITSFLFAFTLLLIYVRISRGKRVINNHEHIAMSNFTLNQFEEEGEDQIIFEKEFVL